MNKQREVVYGFRNDVIQGDAPREAMFEIIEEVVETRVQEYCPAGVPEEEWDVDGLVHWSNHAFPIGLRPDKIAFKSTEEVQQTLLDLVTRAYEAKAANEQPEALKAIERLIILNALDRLWQEHLYNMDQLRGGIGLRAYGQKDPLMEYKAEAYNMFEEMMSNVKSEIASNAFRSASSLEAFESFLRSLPQKLSAPDLSSGSAFQGATAGGQAAAAAGGQAETSVVDDAIATAATPQRRETPKVGRNQPCPCGSGKKYKTCCAKA